jgi:hypothetical protein
MFCEPNLKKLDRKLICVGVPVVAGRGCKPYMGLAAGIFDPVMT